MFLPRPSGGSAILYRMNALSFSVLRRLADGEFHSGAALASALGVSRGTVWNAVRAMRDAGLEVYRVPGRGYRLPQPVSLLDEARVRALLRERATRLHIEVAECTESTNT